jgi:hypothetical protein
MSLLSTKVRFSEVEIFGAQKYNVYRGPLKTTAKSANKTIVFLGCSKLSFAVSNI